MAQPRSGDQRPGPFWAAARAHALSAAALHDLAVLPLSRSKLPAISSAHPEVAAPCTGQCGRPGHGVHDATADPVRVRELFARAPWAAGYGIACGRSPHHLFGLDLDRKNGVDGTASLRALADRHGFRVPRTATVATHSGGWHLWLAAPSDLRIPNTVGLLAPGIDTRGAGGYLVGPGSWGPQGRYRFAPGLGPRHIASVPAPLLELLLTPQAPERASQTLSQLGSPQRRLDGLVRTVRATRTGRNNCLYWAARRAFAAPDIDPETATADLLAAALQTGLPEAEAQHTLASARRGAAREKEATL